MKKILFVASITLVGLSAAFAQDLKQNAAPALRQTRTTDDVSKVRKVDPEMSAQRRTERLNKELTLTEPQKQKVHDLFLKEAKENQGRATQNKETEAQLKAILTAEQNQKYEALKEERKQMMSERRGPVRMEQ